MPPLHALYFCLCGPPGWVTLAVVSPVVSVSSFCAMSPSDTMPTRRFSRLTTGRRRTLMSPMFCATWSRSSSSKQYFTSLLITSRTGVSGPLPTATARIAISRSVIMPTSRSFSPTGIEPASISAMIFATSRMLCPGLATRTSRVIASLTRMVYLLGGLHPTTEQEIDRNRDGGHRRRDAAADRKRRGGNREHRLLRGRSFGGRNEQRERRGDDDPAADVCHQHPAHGP